jgi:hypothetical protein
MVNHQIQTVCQGLSTSNLQAFNVKAMPTAVKGVRRVKIHKEANQKNEDCIKKNTGEMEKYKKHRIQLLGDSHARGCSELTKTNLNKEFDVTGIVKPGAKSSDILNANIDKSMTKDDIIVVYAGSNEISKNGAKEVINNITNFVKNISHSNIIVMKILHRHDLADWSCVNK